MTAVVEESMSSASMILTIGACGAAVIGAFWAIHTHGLSILRDEAKDAHQDCEDSITKLDQRSDGEMKIIRAHYHDLNNVVARLAVKIEDLKQ